MIKEYKRSPSYRLYFYAALLALVTLLITLAPVYADNLARAIENAKLTAYEEWIN